jgi:XTP/dITP diphosphohydrolase
MPAEPGLTVILTSPRVPAGLLTAAAWRAVSDADVVLTGDWAAPLARAVAAEAIEVQEIPQATSQDLLALAARAAVVWLAADDGDEPLVRSLATAVVDEPGIARVEVLVGSYDAPGARLLDLVEVMDRLRRECPWDRVQTHESLVRYLVEESYETVEAIETGDRDHLREELGDLLLQVLFHARIASEDDAEPFTIDDVAAGIVDKLVRRHPHVFGDVDAADAAAVEANWETIKAEEKGRDSAMDGIPLGLPALSLADKVVARAKAGDPTLLSVLAPDETAYTAESVGDVLFAVVAAAHAAGIDPEQALRARVRTEIDSIRGLESKP